MLAPLVALLLCVASWTSDAFADDLSTQIAKAMEGTKTPALAALVMRDGKIAEEGVRGVRRNDRPDPARIDDVWLIGSDAKPMTAAMVARLVDRGKLKWDMPLSEMLPDLADSMRPEYRSVTLVQLLSHRSGLPHDIGDLKYVATFYTDARPLDRQRLAYISRALKEPPVVAPGTTFSYSNTGFLIAAVIAERVTGRSYEDLMRREIFHPLGMSSVGFGPTHNGQPQGHNNGKPVSKADDSNPLMFAPAGNVFMSMRDWAKFCLDQMAGDHGHGKLLKAATYKMMETPLPGTKNGLSWGIQDSIAGLKGPVLMHAGSDGNWNALVALFPESENGVLVATNSAEDMGGDKASTALLKALLPSLSPPK
jgi:CubicO group peptidase (beta-lactamase class C family)